MAIADHASVTAWREGLQRQWGEDVLGAEPGKLDTLLQFCAFVQKSPDALVAHCFLRRRETAERFASVRRRAEVAGWLREFRDRSGLPTAQARALASDVLSFLIHNGVMMHTGML
jgi:hypothetical protein